MEPSPGVYDWDWLDRAIAVLASEGLKIVLGHADGGGAQMALRSSSRILPVVLRTACTQLCSRRHASAASARWRAEKRTHHRGDGKALRHA